MTTSKIIGTILIIISLGIGYLSYNKITDSSASVNLLGLKIDASDESGKQEGYLLVALSVVLFAGGIYTLNKAKI